MSLKTVIETTDGLDEALKPFYTEQDGKFFLQIADVDEHPEVKSLKVAYERSKDDIKTLKSERDGLKVKVANLPEDFDPQKWEKLKDGKPDEAALIKVRQTLEAERDEWKDKYDAQVELGRKNVLDRDLTQQLAANGVTDPMLQTAARAVLADKVQSSDDGSFKIDIGLAPMELGEGVKRFLAGDGKAFVSAPKGGGSKSGNDGGVVSKEQFASMGDKERTELFHSDPERFKELSALN